MKLQFPILALVATIAFSNETALPAKAKTYPEQKLVTVFRCISYNDAFATIAERGDRRSAPMITWESRAFGPEYTPEQRCKTVSQRLSTAVVQNGGKMSNLLLTTGRVNGQAVICYVNSIDSSCNSSNLLFSLNPENAKAPGAALASLIHFGQLGAGTSLHESADQEDGDKPQVDLEATVERAFAASDSHQGSNPQNIPPSDALESK
jgi:hypothetical protein